MRLTRTGQARKRLEFAPRYRRQIAIQRTQAARRGHVGNATPVGPERATAQFVRAGIRRIRDDRRRGRLQTRKTQTCGQQIIGIASMGGLTHGGPRRRLVHRLLLRCGRPRGRWIHR